MPIALTAKFATHTNTPGRYYDTHPGLHFWVKTLTCLVFSGQV
jgi:hypothetical protein